MLVKLSSTLSVCIWMEGYGVKPVDVGMCEPAILQDVRYEGEAQFVARNRQSAVT
jgi:hypothetical protein